MNNVITFFEAERKANMKLLTTRRKRIIKAVNKIQDLRCRYVDASVYAAFGDGVHGEIRPLKIVND